MSYVLHLFVVTAIYSLLALSLDLSVGLTALVAISHGALFGIGAYVAANGLAAGIDGFSVLLIAGAAGTCTGLALALTLRRLGGDYFAIASFALQAAATAAFFNLERLTGGATGLQGYGALTVFGRQIVGGAWILGLVLAVLALLAFIKNALWRSPFGRLCATLREDEVAVVALGHDPVRLRVALFSIGAAFAAVAGAFHAAYLGFVNPAPFGVEAAIAVLSCVILGGPGSTAGPVLGATIFVLLPELLRFVGLPASQAANLRAVVFGAALLLAMIFLPHGVLGRTTVGQGHETDAAR
jgi:branched-chain amino acid transport system permease protein